MLVVSLDMCFKPDIVSILPNKYAHYFFIFKNSQENILKKSLSMTIIPQQISPHDLITNSPNETWHQPLLLQIKDNFIMWMKDEKCIRKNTHSFRKRKPTRVCRWCTIFNAQPPGKTSKKWKIMFVQQTKFRPSFFIGSFFPSERIKNFKKSLVRAQE